MHLVKVLQVPFLKLWNYMCANQRTRIVKAYYFYKVFVGTYKVNETTHEQNNVLVTNKVSKVLKNSIKKHFARSFKSIYFMSNRRIHDQE